MLNTCEMNMKTDMIMAEEDISQVELRNVTYWKIVDQEMDKVFTCHICSHGIIQAHRNAKMNHVFR